MSELFKIYEENITHYKVMQMYPDAYMILLISAEKLDNPQGDLIFIGDYKEWRLFRQEYVNKCPDGYIFFNLKGQNLEKLESGSVILLDTIREGE